MLGSAAEQKVIEPLCGVDAVGERKSFCRSHLHKALEK
jgi:hypothetical protein